ncbi:MAG: FAD-binding oxidoreductase [Proteobacteria bacterium]|nr:FAD-binding oxidoreductase [Pseudomonadota bacterium]
MSALGEELREALGAESIVEHPPVEWDGHKLELTFRPPDGDRLAKGLALLSERGLAALVRGGGTRSHWGNRAERADLILSTEALTGIDTLDTEDGVVHVAAGTRLDEVRAAANSGGWELPLDPPGEGTTVGGALSAAAIGPRRLGFGPPRDCVLGLEVALASGERTRCGGRVMKNVTGYDLAKLYTGAFGTLGVIERAWLRLRPLPASLEVRVAEVPSSVDPFALTLELARRTTTRVAALVGPGPAERIGSGCLIEEGWVLVAEFAGDSPATERDLEWLEGRVDALPADADVVGGLRRIQGAPVAPPGLRARIAVLPSALPETCAGLEASDLELVVHPGLGLVYVESHADLDGSLGAVDGAAARGCGSAMYESLPSQARAGRDVFGASPDVVPLMRALKERFDPTGTLNPGRFAGGL